MGAYKRLIEDYADLQTQDITDLPERHRSCDRVFREVCDDADHAGFLTFLKTLRIVEKIEDCENQHQRLRWATKLWNAIDCLECPEVPWRLMLQELPDCFDRDSVNCLKFTY